MNEIANLQPSCIWRNFDALTKVPRPSGHLEKVQQFLLDFAKRVGVEAFIDEGNNIVMKKPATPGMERRKVVLMQAHMDMVPQKSPESNHNFETDPIETYIDGEGWVRAKGTTLGADNGLGVAAIMAVMEATDLQHGPVEGLITADEETGMFGANDLPKGELNGDIMLNLDSEMWGKFVIGSAGGVDVDTTLDYEEVETDPEDAALKVTLKGLRGGHSGLEIHEGRANANKLMVRFVREAIETCEARLVSWNGGNMRNAIPFKAEVVLTMPKENVEAVKALVDDWKADFEDEYKYIEENIEFFAEKVETPKTEVPVEIQDNLIDAIYACHNGVVRMIPAYPDVVETSSNLAIIKIENGKAAFKILVRSSREDMKDYAVKTLESCFNMAGMKVEASGSYGGWDPNPNSEILNMLKRIYKEQNGKEAIVQVDHAGLECSVILEKYPNMDVVSLGPTLLSPHTTNERCQISTVEPFWKLLKQVLIEVPEK
ncbi:aminoacyl-histidine dipeptidase [Prevotella sp. HMSC077E09]|uniref:aminoacyl-histidine dipeptidase n=1 Tax=Prevotella sp. HMSC077E09 TaxID=1739487 RepID=UPI0008A3AA77|nr:MULTISPECIES: aminoacyl-histidine dipeptidase [unclassified Prevotella]OFO83186.1 aminoacyl-histidine dipeptidase [Prevotella sp. HMSC077E08]OFP58303.1 aminoacyl-histidine dipeptidase [Prevotella sp. HMSC077E09]